MHLDQGISFLHLGRVYMKFAGVAKRNCIKNVTPVQYVLYVTSACVPNISPKM